MDLYHDGAERSISSAATEQPVRNAAGIDFCGLDPSTSWMIAEVEMDEEPEFGFRRNSAGTHALGQKEDRESVGVVLTERHLNHTGDPSMDLLSSGSPAPKGAA